MQTRVNRGVWGVLLVLITLGAAAGVGGLGAQEGPTLPPAAAPPADLTGARPSPAPPGFRYPTLDVDRQSLLDLLRTGQYQALDRLFESLEEAASRDIRREDELVVSYSAFFGSDKSIAPYLDEWVASHPQSDAALVARAQFQRARYWEIRGEGQLTEADSLRLPLRTEAARAAFDDASLAIWLDQDNLAAHSALLSIVMPWGWSETSEVVLDSALTRFPASHWLRDLALWGMSPRWGGSYERMQRLVDEAQVHAPANRRLLTLRGALALDRAGELRIERRYAESLVALEQARRYGTDWSFYYRRGRTYYAARDYVRALAQLDSAIALHPNATGILEYRGKALARIARQVAPPQRRVALLEHAEVDLREAVAFSQPDSALSAELAWVTRWNEVCSESPADCLEARPETRSEVASEQDMVDMEPEHWWQRAILFLLSIPVTLYLVLAEGNNMLLLPAPLLAGLSLVVNFREWRRQRFWTPRIIHVMAGLAFLTLVLINVDWVMAGGVMWTQRYVVIAVSVLVPYVLYLVMFGPKHLGRRRPTPPTGADQGPLT